MNLPSALRWVRFALVIWVALSSKTTWAEWPGDPLVNLPVCTNSSDQLGAAIASDGANGAIFAWYDYRTGRYGLSNVFAQHVLASGAPDPGWPANGLQLSDVPAGPGHPALVADGAGGAVIAWEGYNTGSGYDIYAQHILASGKVDPAWPARGQALCSAPNDQRMPAIASDGAGGAIVAWRDLRSGSFRLQYQVYAQRILADGDVDPTWPVDGVPISTPFGPLRPLSIISDGSGGAIVAWGDGRGYTFAQHVLVGGTVDSRWPVNGSPLSTVEGGADPNPGTIMDGAGGAIVAWHDWRSGDADIYAQHVLASGATDPAWPLGGMAVCVAPYEQAYPAITTDGGTGAVVAWQDERNGTDKDIYAQHLLATGVVDPTWPMNGQAICVAPQDQLGTAIVSDQRAGAIVTWEDGRSGIDVDIYAQHVLANGRADPAWAVNGQAISTAPRDQVTPGLVAAGFGGAIIGWNDLRNGNWDIYAQNVNADGTLGGDTRLGVPPPPSRRGAWLGPATPNPALDGTTVRFGLPREGRISLEIYDAQGRRARSLQRGTFAPGEHSARWDGRDDLGRPVASGLYFLRLEVGGVELTKRLAVTR